MSIRDDKKDLNAAGGPIPAERVAEAEDQDTKKAGTKLSDEPGPEFRVASAEESEEEHALTTDSPRWGEEGSSREDRGYSREGGEEPRVGKAPSERDLPPRK
ncbi:hypothetical protein [Vitiosangium sp. GDMCC 1.1324]|uniref:hypothetical protein n=1 Tax=Vitiosangium sp. (strain GDMCC 1.1324) TaxID=2138576 RepID=UPI000D36C097|nr:hypothetical protein [Vitiosangium sp. GDMCC 1.1324]PTL84096.1 hypothetical protein DAT35_11660 [Vitiosangium sp. GDMCC 1.1324]